MKRRPWIVLTLLFCPATLALEAAEPRLNVPPQFNWDLVPEVMKGQNQ